MKHTRMLYLSIVIAFSCMSADKTTYASTGDVDYSVEAIDHAKQVNKKLSYFDLLVEPDETTNLEILVHNETDKTEVFDVSFVDATTNGNGLIVYEKTNLLSDGSLSVKSFTQKDKQQVQVKAFSSQKVIIPIQIPEKSFKGVYLGGIRVEKKTDETSEKKIGINNRYVYVLGVKLSMNLIKQTFKPTWEGVELNTESYYPVLDYRLKNQTQSISSPLKVEMQLKKGKKIVARQYIDARLVPKGEATLRFRLQKELQAGKYTTILKMRDEENKQTWQWKDTVTISEKEQALVNANITSEKSDPPESQSLLWITVAVLGLLFCLMMAYIGYLQKRVSTQSKRSA